MVDAVDMAGAIEAETVARAVAQAAVPLRQGATGDCEGCDSWMPRLVDGLCGFCRDGRPRPPDWEPPRRSDASAPPLTRKESPPMADKPKNIMLPASAGSAIAAVERHAAEHDVSLGAAAAELIGRGIAAALEASASPTPATLEDLLDHLRELYATRDQASVDAAVADANARAVEAEQAREAADARAVGAEQALADLKARIGALAG